MVISDVNQIVYIGNGSQTAWPFTFRIIDNTDIRLVLINKDGSQTDIETDYYVDMVNNTVYYPGYAPGAEPPEEEQPPKVQAGQKIVVFRSLPETQTKDLGDKWPFYVIELGLDKLTMLIQDLRDIVNRCLKVSVADAVNKNFDTTLPIKPGKLLRVRDDGTGFEAVSDAPDAAKEAAMYARAAAEAAARVTWVNNFKIDNDYLCQIVDE